MTNAELLAFLFDTSEPDEPLTRWIAGSRRFPAFVAGYRTKIRKKLRLAVTPESRRSLLLELDIARRLVDDPRCAVEYEKYGQGRERTPDLTVTFRTHTVFHIEATRLQSAQTEKLIRVVCDKLGQTIPRTINALVVAADDGAPTQEELDDALKALQRRVEQREGGHDDPAAFFKAFQQLSAIVVCRAGPALVWTNPQARCPLPAGIRTVLETRLSGLDEETLCPPD